MVNMAPPTKTLGVTLLHKCKFNCPHCGYLYVDNSEAFFKNMSPPPKEDNLSYPIGTLVEENYLHKGKKVARLGNLKDLAAKATGA